MNKLQTIREKCIEANLRLEADFMGDEFEYTIRLADVLMAVNALPRPDKLADLGKGDWWIPRRVLVSTTRKEAWNLKDNNLNNQSEECINFLFKLLK